MKTIIILLSVVGLFFTACTKEKEAPQPTYETLSVGLMNIEETYMIDGVTKITWKVPDGNLQTSIGISIGDAQLMGQQMSAIGTQPAELVLTTTKAHARFRTTNPNAKTVQIITLE